MGKLTKFFLSFTDNQRGIYNPGDIISGSVTAELHSPMEVRGI